MNITREERQQGGVWGQLAGDALGVPYENTLPEKLPQLPQDLAGQLPLGIFHRSHPDAPFFAYSDDGARMLCLLATLKANGGKFNADGFAQRMLRWFDHGYMAVKGYVFGTGGTTRTALDRLRSGTPATESGLVEETAMGNGGLMGAVALPLFFKGSDEELIEAAMAQCRVTHAHARARVTVAVFCLWVRAFLDDPEATPAPLAVEMIRRFRELCFSGDEFTACDYLTASLTGRFGPPTGGFNVVDTFCSAVACQGASYESTVKSAILLGNDTDTTAAVAGGVAGVRFGVRNIPLRWREAVERNAPPEALAALPTWRA